MKNYRLLNEEDTIRDGDEWWDSHLQEWLPNTHSIGHKHKICHLQRRREIHAFEDKCAREPFRVQSGEFLLSHLEALRKLGWVVCCQMACPKNLPYQHAILIKGDR